jgi:hypothetical protein
MVMLGMNSLIAFYKLLLLLLTLLPFYIGTNSIVMVKDGNCQYFFSSFLPNDILIEVLNNLYPAIIIDRSVGLRNYTVI